jgi:phage tail sheath gpL-like
MAANLRLTLNLRNRDTDTLARLQAAGQPMRYSMLEQLAQLVKRVSTGNEPGDCKVEVYAATNKATGTVTCASVQANDTVTVNGVVFTAKASGAVANEFNVGVSDTACATNLAAAINASVTALIPNYVVATSALGVVTLTSAFFGLAGNQTTLASSNGTRLAVSAARLTGGTADSSQITYAF